MKYEAIKDTFLHSGLNSSKELFESHHPMSRTWDI